MNDEQKQAFALIRHICFDDDHKKTRAAYAVSVLYLMAVAAIIEKPGWRACDHHWFAFTLWVVASVFVVPYVGWQLWNHRASALLVSAATKVAADWSYRAPEAPQYEAVEFRGKRWPRALVLELNTRRYASLRRMALILALLLVGAVAVGYLIAMSC